MTVKKPQTLTITVRQLADLITPVMPAVSRDDMLPVLNAIRFEVHGKWLLAMATDRYRCAVKRQETTSKKFDATIRLGDINTILRLFKPNRSTDPEIALTVVAGQDSDTLSVASMDGFDFIDASIKFSLEKSSFPKILQMFDDAKLNPPESTWFGVNPHYLADWRLGAPRHEPLIVLPTVSTKPGREGEPGPVVVAYGDDFIGMQMPMKVGTGKQQPDLTHWREVFGEPQSDPKVA